MLKTAGRLSKLTNYIMVGLLYALVVMQFLPFWTTGDGAVTMSIQEYIWWPLEKPDGPAMTKYFQGLYGSDWLIGDIVLMPCMTLICAIITFFFGIKRPNRLWMNIVYLVAGICGLSAYLGDPIYQLNPIYIVHVILCALLVVTSIVNVTARPWKKIMHYLKYGE